MLLVVVQVLADFFEDEAAVLRGREKGCVSVHVPVVGRGRRGGLNVFCMFLGSLLDLLDVLEAAGV